MYTIQRFVFLIACCMTIARSSAHELRALQEIKEKLIVIENRTTGTFGLLIKCPIFRAGVMQKETVDILYKIPSSKTITIILKKKEAYLEDPLWDDIYQAVAATYASLSPMNGYIRDTTKKMYISLATATKLRIVITNTSIYTVSADGTTNVISS